MVAGRETGPANRFVIQSEVVRKRLRNGLQNLNGFRVTSGPMPSPGSTVILRSMPDYEAKVWRLPTVHLCRRRHTRGKAAIRPSTLPRDSLPRRNAHLVYVVELRWDRAVRDAQSSNPADLRRSLPLPILPKRMELFRRGRGGSSSLGYPFHALVGAGDSPLRA